MLTQIVTAFVTLFVVVDPLGLAPLFITLTRGMGEERRAVATQASFIAFAVLAGAALIGNWLLHTLGIGLPAFRIAGGLLLFTIAFEQVFERRQERKAKDASDTRRPDAGVAAFPLAIPLMAGPGAITACILLAGQAASDPRRMAVLFLVIAAAILTCRLVFWAAPTLERLLGEKGEIIFARLLGVLLAALAVQYVVDGILAIHAA